MRPPQSRSEGAAHDALAELSCGPQVPLWHHVSIGITLRCMGQGPPLAIVMAWAPCRILLCDPAAIVPPRRRLPWSAEAGPDPSQGMGESSSLHHTLSLW